MEQNNCPNCSASMIIIANYDGTKSWKCEYCGNVIPIYAKTVSDKVFAFVNRVANAFSDQPIPGEENRTAFPGITDPAKRAEMDEKLRAINEKRQKMLEAYQEKKLRSYEKYIEKRTKKFGK